MDELPSIDEIRTFLLDYNVLPAIENLFETPNVKRLIEKEHQALISSMELLFQKAPKELKSKVQLIKNSFLSIFTVEIFSQKIREYFEKSIYISVLVNSNKPKFDLELAASAFQEILENLPSSNDTDAVNNAAIDMIKDVINALSNDTISALLRDLYDDYMEKLLSTEVYLRLRKQFGDIPIVPGSTIFGENNETE